MPQPPPSRTPPPGHSRSQPPSLSRSQNPASARSQAPAPSRSQTPAPARTPPLSGLEHAIEEAQGGADDVTLTQLFTRNLTRALMVGSIPAAIALVATTTAWIVSSVPPIRAAASATYTAENDYVAALKQSQPLMTALSEWGTPVARLESAWFAFAEAPPDQRAETADRLMTVLVDQVQEVRSTRGDAASDLVVLLSDATRARRRASDAWHEWSDRTSSMRGRLAVLTGLATTPPPELARYDEPLPDGRELPVK